MAEPQGIGQTAEEKADALAYVAQLTETETAPKDVVPSFPVPDADEINLQRPAR